MKEKKKMTYAQKRSFWGILFLLPWAIGILVFFLGPLVRTFYYSFFEMEYRCFFCVTVRGLC